MDSQNILKITVDELSNSLYTHISNQYPYVIDVVGEISEYRPPKKHAYFSLIGKGTQLRCCVWKSKLSRIRDTLENGIDVIVRGTLDFYRVRNECSFIVNEVYRLDKGAQSDEYDKILEYCNKEGLITTQPKSFPNRVQSIAIITSSTGAAIRDIIAVFQSNSIGINIYIFNIDVQGQRCVLDCIHALESVKRFSECIPIELVYITRGGGADADLAWFNDIDICKSVYQWKINTDIPILSAIGHEKDSTIVDQVVDYHLGTPSIGADFIIRTGHLNRTGIEHRLDELFSRLHRYTKIVEKQLLQKLQCIETKIQNSMNCFEYKMKEIVQKSNYMKKRFIAMIVQRMSSIRQKCDTRIIVSQYNEKERNLKQLEKRCRTIQHKMRELVYNRMKRIVETNSISKILEQGFMIPLTLDGKVIQSLDNYFGKPIQLYTNDKIVKVVCKNVG
jgi:exodeoxyribonuclease VII large subunit